MRQRRPSPPFFPPRTISRTPWALQHIQTPRTPEWTGASARGKGVAQGRSCVDLLMPGFWVLSSGCRVRFFMAISGCSHRESTHSHFQVTTSIAMTLSDQHVPGGCIIVGHAPIDIGYSFKATIQSNHLSTTMSTMINNHWTIHEQPSSINHHHQP